MTLSPTLDPLAAAVRGDEVAFAVLYREMQPPLLRYLRVVVGADAEDVAADVWLEIARDIRTFDGDKAALRAWIFTVGRHRGIDLLRSRGRRRSTLVAELPESRSPDDTEACALDALSTEAALALISALPRDQAEAVILRIVAGLDVAETARILGKRPGAVRVNTMRGLRRLKALLPHDLDATGVTQGTPATLF